MDEQTINTLVRDNKLLKEDVESLKKQFAALSARVKALESPRDPRPSLYKKP